MKKLFVIYFVLLFLLLSACTSKKYEPYIEINNQKIKVILAISPEEQKNGLSNYTKLADGQGMLFIYKNKTIPTFWMKSMNFPLDIIWIEDDKIIKIDKNLVPEGDKPENTYAPDKPINYVLEINRGLSDRYNLKVGGKIIFNL